MTLDSARLDELVAFVGAHSSDPDRSSDLVAAKAALLERVLGPAADRDVVGPMTTPGRPNGIVVHGDEVMVEFGDTDYVDEIASATKSFLALVCGIAVDDGVIADIDGPVAADVDLDEFAGDRNARITWRHLLQQTSEWEGSLFGKVPTGHRGDRIDEPLGPPGSYFEYNDVRVNLLGRALLEVFGRSLPDVLAERIMEPIGVSATWSWHGYSTSWVDVGGRRIESVSGGSHWGGGIWMSSRDLARVGSLVLHGGVTGGRRILSERWVAEIRRPSRRNPMYGLMWWLQYDDAGQQVSFAAEGGGSHQCFVVPDRDLVAVVRWIRDDAWPELLDRVLALPADVPALGPVRYRFDAVNVSGRDDDG